MYDDVVTQESVGTPDTMAKTLSRWELSDNLGTKDGIARHVGTRYHANDAYGHMMQRAAVVPRLHPATEDGKAEGEPVFLSRELLQRKRRVQGVYTFACQQLLNPTADSAMGFHPEWWQTYRVQPPRQRMNVYILVDSASKKKRESDYTAFAVIGLADDNCYYLLDAVRDRLNLKQRADTAMRLHRQWKPLRFGWEEYGLQADIEYLREVQERESYRFTVVRLGGRLGNEDRVRRLIPAHEELRWWYPETLPYRDWEGSTIDLARILREEEFVPFPVGVHVDLLDAMSRVHDEDMHAQFPRNRRLERDDDKPEHARANYHRYGRRKRTDLPGGDEGDYA